MSRAPTPSSTIAGPFKDPRLPPGFTATKTASGEIELMDGADSTQKTFVAPLFFALSVASMAYIYDARGATGSELFDRGQACVGFAFWMLFSSLFWKVLERQVLVVGPNLFEIRSLHFGTARCSRHADGRISLQRISCEDGYYFCLNVMQQFGPLNWNFHERGSFPAGHAWPQQLISFGNFLHEITGWPFDIPQDVRAKM